MSQEQKPIRIAIGDNLWTRALVDGSVSVDSFAVEFHSKVSLPDRLHGVREGKWHGSDGTLTDYLLEKDAGNQPVRWIEVKAMTGSLEHRPVTLSHTQFEHALQKRGAYWLYVVEFATTPEHRRILRIQDPAGNAKSFTFDKGWAKIALTGTPS